MDNPIYLSLKRGLEDIFETLTPWQRPNGVRSQNEKRGKITLYYANIYEGNVAEIAVHIPSIANRAKKTQRDTLDFFNNLAIQTGMPVKKNQVYRWERVGVATEEHALLVLREIRQFLDE